MKKTLACLAATAFVLSVGAANAADKKELAIVVKGLDNPFFTVLGNGCAKWNEENPDSEYMCTYNGPALSSDEAGEVQLVADLIAKGVAGIAISPSNAPAMAAMLREKAPSMPIMTIDADLLPDDANLRMTYLGTDNYQMGVLMAKYLKELKPDGGKICLQLGNVSAANINARAAGLRDTIAGTKNTDRLTGQGGFTEIDGCPVFTNDDIATANQQLADVTAANQDLDAFVLVGGWAQFGPEAYAATTTNLESRTKSGQLVIVAGDTLPPQMDALKAGHSMVQIGQRPFQMGHDAPGVLIKLIDGQSVDDPLYTGLDECTMDNADTCLGS